MQSASVEAALELVTDVRLSQNGVSATAESYSKIIAAAGRECKGAVIDAVLAEMKAAGVPMTHEVLSAQLLACTRCDGFDKVSCCYTATTANTLLACVYCELQYHVSCSTV
jgi:hypothetical protein